MADKPKPKRVAFVDEVQIIGIAGDGGNGCMAFRREKYVARGGPSGGDGGNGGSVYLIADESYTTLQHLAGHHHWRADRGQHGMGKEMHGRRGKDIYIRVPAGTIIFDAEYDLKLKDLTEVGQSVCVAQGGKGGKGNTRFKTATHQAPRTTEPGEPGQERKMRLELKLIADAGLIGKPNAGKSTLLSRLSSARPKIADYPFTTLAPCLGIVEMSRFRRFVLADIPGLIEGAHTGAGLGDEFLKHVERTRILVHMLDIFPPEGDPATDYRAIRNELEQYSPLLGEKAEIVVANKTDLTGSDEALAELSAELGMEVIGISAVTGAGLARLTERIWQVLAGQAEQADHAEQDPQL